MKSSCVNQNSKLLLIVFLLLPMHAVQSFNDLEGFSLNELSLREFLSVVTGEIKIGNHTITFPQDFPKLFPLLGNSFFEDVNRRGFSDDETSRIKIKIHHGFDAHGGHHGRKKGLISLNNFFRLGCILFDLKEMQDSARNGLF